MNIRKSPAPFHIGVSISDGELAALSGPEIAGLARRLDGVVDYWLIGADRGAPHAGESHAGESHAGESHAGESGPATVDPTVVATFAARHTTDLGYVVAAAAHRDHPYNLARRLLSLDHATGGRAGWFAADADTAVALGTDADAWTSSPLGAEHTAAAIDAVRTLWRAWPLASVVADVNTGVFVDTDLVRAADIAGHFAIAGPLPLPGSIQHDLPVFGRRPGAGGTRPDILVIDQPGSVERVETERSPISRVVELSETAFRADPIPGGFDGAIVTTSLSDLDDLLRSIRSRRPGRDASADDRTLRARLGVAAATLPDPGRNRRVFASVRTAETV
ncbi:LLM class oxidoreductase [Gordonia insulae]|nr:LLM class flavin-dependent oxidoreductase [Gordonia insulae]